MSARFRYKPSRFWRGLVRVGWSPGLFTAVCFSQSAKKDSIAPKKELTKEEKAAQKAKYEADLMEAYKEAELSDQQITDVKAAIGEANKKSNELKTNTALSEEDKKTIEEAVKAAKEKVDSTNKEEIEKALDTFGAPYVVKHDGLAAGKGVVVTNDRTEALEHALLSPRVVIEEYLDGPEISLFGISDGTYVLPMQPAQDFKRAYDGDNGLNTGGMGAYSPLPWAPEDIEEEVLKEVLQPTVDAMAKRGTPFVGLLYAGLAMTSKGIRVIEFNARFGDPETQVLLPRLKTPLGQLLYAAATKNLNQYKSLDWSDDCAVTVVLASEGYPSEPKINLPVTGLNLIADTFIFHAGTKLVDGVLTSSSGRVLTVTGMGTTLTEARNNAYQVISGITLAGSHYRSDIALSASQLGKS